MDDFLSSAAINPNLFEPTLPPVPPLTLPTGPTGNTGPTGPTGGTGSAGIVNVFFTGDNEPVPPFTTPTLNLPLITVLPGQMVILDCFATGDFFPFENGSEFGAGIEIRLLRDGDPITTGNENIFNIITTSLFAQITLNPSIMWVDTPPPGTYQYSLSIIATRLNTNDTRDTLGPRAIRAIIVNTL
ncbi:exosporium leader peptide-containing protein [Bacillus cereus]|uniref:exosporium leader peptide-containing protein n=1 Tax=Bacillus cereus TaxID=1396 RepID=UPI00338E563E